VKIEVVHAGSVRELDDAFVKTRQLAADALIVHIDALFQANDKQVVALAAKYACRRCTRCANSLGSEA
jgi:hypothetical protein